MQKKKCLNVVMNKQFAMVFKELNHLSKCMMLFEVETIDLIKISNPKRDR